MNRVLTRSTAALLAAVVALAAVVLALAVTVPAAWAADRAVMVAPDGELAYAPADLEVQVGDRITFTWGSDGHSVSEFVASDADNPIESHADCDAFLGVPDNDCGDEGDRYRWTALEPGEYEFRCRVHTTTMVGTITVTEAPSESPSPTASPSASPSDEPSPTASPDPSGSPTPDPSGSPSPDPSGSESPSGEPSDDPSEDPSGEPSDDPSASASPSATPTPSPEPIPEAPSVEPIPEALPSVPVPDPTFDAFPEAVDPSVAPSDDVMGEVAIGGDDGGDEDRMLWALVGGAGVLGTLGAIGRTVLGDAWQ